MIKGVGRKQFCHANASWINSTNPCGGEAGDANDDGGRVAVATTPSPDGNVLFGDGVVFAVLVDGSGGHVMTLPPRLNV